MKTLIEQQNYALDNPIEHEPILYPTEFVHSPFSVEVSLGIQLFHIKN